MSAIAPLSTLRFKIINHLTTKIKVLARSSYWLGLSFPGSPLAEIDPEKSSIVEIGVDLSFWFEFEFTCEASDKSFDRISWNYRPSANVVTVVHNDHALSYTTFEDATVDLVVTIKHTNLQLHVMKELNLIAEAKKLMGEKKFNEAEAKLSEAHTLFNSCHVLEKIASNMRKSVKADIKSSMEAMRRVLGEQSLTKAIEYESAKNPEKATEYFKEASGFFSDAFQYATYEKDRNTIRHWKSLIKEKCEANRLFNEAVLIQKQIFAVIQSTDFATALKAHNDGEKALRLLEEAKGKYNLIKTQYLYLNRALLEGWIQGSLQYVEKLLKCLAPISKQLRERQLQLVLERINFDKVTQPQVYWDGEEQIEIEVY